MNCNAHILLIFNDKTFSIGLKKGSDRQSVVVDDFREYLVDEMDKSSFKDFVKTMREAMPDASIFLPGRFIIFVLLLS